MCGIAGVVNLKESPVDKRIVKKMTVALRHRGPNGEGLFVDRYVGLGHRRLSIIDLSSAGNQPMFNDDGSIAIIFNGEIYNYLELKKELRSGKYRSETDTEVIIRAYERWGTACVEKLNGIFAFAIWDKKKKIFFAARDRLGVKPFYYTVRSGVFYFASEIKSILAAGVPAQPNDDMIYDYLVRGYYDHSENTFFKGIGQLQAGHVLIIRKGKIKTKRYWYLPKVIRERALSDQAAAGKFLRLVKDAVRLQLRSDVPVGLSVSGGLDSSLLMGVVHEISGGQKNFNLQHFAYAGKGYEEELPSVNLLTKKFRWGKPNVTKVQPRDFSALAGEIMKQEEQPFPGLPTIAWHKMYRNLSTTPTIVTLEGHGGDEIAAGYDYYFGAFLLDVARSRGAGQAMKELTALGKARGLSPEKLPKFLKGSLQAFFEGGVSADATPFLCHGVLKKTFLNKKVPFPKFEAPFRSSLANFQYRELMHTKLPRVLRSVDRESMAYGRELRVPLLDHRIVEFAFSLPVEQRIKSGNQRFFMRQAAKKILPKEIAETPKRSIPNPQRAWFQQELRPWILSVLSSKSFGRRKYFDQAKVLAEYEKYCKTPNPANSFAIWQWLSIELWFKAFID